MRKALIILFLSVLPVFLFAQENTEIRYFRDVNLKRKSEENKALYKLVSISHEDDLIEKLIEIKSDKLIWLKSYRKEKPYGTWYFLNDKNSKMDSVVYGKFEPQGFYLYDYKDNKLLENIEGEFSKPLLIVVDEKINSKANQNKASDLAFWLAFNVKYPIKAHVDGIQGSVKTQFTIDEEGNVGNVRIVQGVHLLLDIESYRVINSLPKMQPGKLNGKPIKLYVETPINFVLF